MQPWQRPMVGLRGLQGPATASISPTFLKDTFVNKNQTHGTIKNATGIIQEEAGKMVGNKEQQAKGLQKQAVGKAEQRLGNAKEKVADALDSVKAAVRKS